MACNESVPIAHPLKCIQWKASNPNTFPPLTYPATYGFTTAVLVSSLHYHSEVILPTYPTFPSPPKIPDLFNPWE